MDKPIANRQAAHYTESMLPTIPWNNNITLLRLLFAAIVLLSHSYALSRAPELARLERWMNAPLAVQGFFILSGFLVVMSYEQSRTARDYFEKRARRIYPAYVTVIVACAFAGATLTTLPISEYFSGAWWRYMVNNLVFLNFRAQELPGVFAANPTTDAVNGALWTIKLEVMFYLLVPLLVWLLKGRRRLPMLGLIYAGSLVYAWYCRHLAIVTGNGFYAELGRQLPGQMCYFITGVALYYYFAWVMARRRWLIAASLLACVCMKVTGNDWLYPAALGMLVMAAAFGPYLGNLSRYGDFSYGLYIWHFPVIQTLVMMGVFTAHPSLGMLASVGITGLLAVISWHRVEKPWLKPSSHYVAATKI